MVLGLRASQCSLVRLALEMSFDDFGVVRNVYLTEGAEGLRPALRQNPRPAASGVSFCICIPHLVALRITCLQATQFGSLACTLCLARALSRRTGRYPSVYFAE